MTVGTGRLGPHEHRAAWERLDGGHVDVLVVGGGVTGTGAALDAAARGLTVALVEARDLASGTSSRSSKLFHGGLRYLEQLDLGLVREALRERELMLTRLAPHLVSPVSFLYPLTHRWWERWYVGAGLAIYDRLGGRSSLPRARHLTRRGALAIAPGLRPDALVGAFQYYDAQVDDARHTVTLARTAAAQGAVVRTSTEVVELLRDGDRVTGAVLRDTDTGATCEVRAGVVVSCTGVWTNDLHQLTGADSPFAVRASKGVHILVPRGRIRLDTGLILRTPTSVLFVIPWGSHWIVGTTDTDWTLDREHPATSRSDVDYILGRVNEVLEDPLGPYDVVGVYAGLRPLLSGASRQTSKLSREHAVAHTAPGLVSVAGGKYTTYRVMARDAIDAAVEELGRGVPPSTTQVLPLLGANGWSELSREADRLAADWAMAPERIARLLRRYGSLLPEVLAPAADDPTLLEPVTGAAEYLVAELRYAVSHEGALHLDDLLTRRTRISVETPHRGADSAAQAAAVAAPLLGWDDAAVAREVDFYRARVSAELAAQAEPGDEAAAALRLQAPAPRRTARRVG